MWCLAHLLARRQDRLPGIVLNQVERHKGRLPKPRPLDGACDRREQRPDLGRHGFLRLAERPKGRNARFPQSNRHLISLDSIG